MHQNENALPAPQNAIVTPTLAFADGEGVAAASGRVAGELLAARLRDASAAALRRENLTATELYTKYAEAADAWRKECVERRRLQSTVDGMVAELEVRAPMLAEQKAEYDRAVAAHAEMRARLENATVELRRLEAEAKSAAAERDKPRDARALEAQSADLSRQVQLLLHETSTLKGGRSGAPPPRRGPRRGRRGGRHGGAGGLQDVAELQDQNKRQLEVIRTLSADQEDLGARLKEKYRAEVEAIQSEAKTALDELESRKAKTQTMVEAIVRQRDMYKALYVSAGAGPGGVADADNAAMTLAEAAAASLAKALPASGGGGGGAPAEARLAALVAELRADLAKHKEESAANAELRVHRRTNTAARRRRRNPRRRRRRLARNSNRRDTRRWRNPPRRSAPTFARWWRRTTRRRDASPRTRRVFVNRRRDWTRRRTARRRLKTRRLARRERATSPRASRIARGGDGRGGDGGEGQDGSGARRRARRQGCARGGARSRTRTIGGGTARLQKEWAASRTELDAERERARVAAAAAASPRRRRPRRRRTRRRRRRSATRGARRSVARKSPRRRLCSSRDSSSRRRSAFERRRTFAPVAPRLAAAPPLKPPEWKPRRRRAPPRARRRLPARWNFSPRRCARGRGGDGQGSHRRRQRARRALPRDRRGERRRHQRNANGV